MTDDSSDLEVFAQALFATVRFCYENGLRLVGISIAWFAASLTGVLLGPATLGTYTAIRSLRGDRKTVDQTAVQHTVREHFVPAVLLGLLPPTFTAIAVVHFLTYARSYDLVAGGLSMLAGYLAFHLFVVLVPTFLALTRGTDLSIALREGLSFTSNRPVLALMIGMVTLCALVTSIALTVAVALVFPAFAFSLHVITIEMTTATHTVTSEQASDRPTPPAESDDSSSSTEEERTTGHV